MADEHVRALQRAREHFTRKRREMAEQMGPAGAATAHFAPAFADLQAAIEAIDRAIKDEEALPPDYAAAEPGHEDSVVIDMANARDDLDSA